MATSSEATSKPSKIPKYLKSSLPFASTDYKKTLRGVREKKVSIEVKLGELKILKTELVTLSTTKTPLTTNRFLALETVSSSSSSAVRTVINTPGGTKRKVTTTHRSFRDKLESVLSMNVEQSPGDELHVENLVDCIEKDVPGAKIMSRANLLRTITSILGVKIKRKGKNKDLCYYPDMALKEAPLHTPVKDSCDQGPNVSPLQKSPTRKSKRGDQESLSSEHRTCKSKLLFAESEQSDASDELVMDVSTQMDALELSSPELSSQFMTMQEELASVKEKVDQLLKQNSTLEGKHTAVQQQVIELESKLLHYKELANKIILVQDDVISLYKDILDCGNLLGGLLTVSERDAISSEVKKTKQIFHLGLRNQGAQDITEKLHPMMFSRMVEDLKRECPTIINILEQLTLSKNVSRNMQKNATMKMKASVHLLASLMDVRDQRSGNDIPVLFGLLCMYYGAGPSLIEVLQNLGLSESFQVLAGVLKQQLANYKEIITLRVQDNKPVITYQDNMQLKRTSMRHLRLSKLCKDKDKQEKLWDFTVRGYRAADTDNLKELFEDKETAVEPQREVKTVKYEDTKIECNKEHFHKWCSFKDRNLLRKLDFCLNAVQLDKEEIRTGSSEFLQEQASKEQQPPLFNLYVPGEDVEFPHLSTRKSRIYPLPMSHENQCKIVGTASNLDLFTGEFAFESQRTKKYLPLRTTGKEFVLDKAYQRYAFTKTLERHKQQQLRYEEILRNQTEEGLSLQVAEPNMETDSGGESD